MSHLTAPCQSWTRRGPTTLIRVKPRHPRTAEMCRSEVLAPCPASLTRLLPSETFVIDRTVCVRTMRLRQCRRLTRRTLSTLLPVRIFHPRRLETRPRTTRRFTRKASPKARLPAEILLRHSQVTASLHLSIAAKAVSPSLRGRDQARLCTPLRP